MRLRSLASLTICGLAATATSAAAATMTADELCKLVTAGSEVRVVYSQDPADAEVRVLDLYGVGTTSAGNLAVFGRQISGYSPKSGGGTATLPDWRTFRLDRLKAVEDTGKSFTAETPKPNDSRLIARWSCTNPAVGAK